MGVVRLENCRPSAAKAEFKQCTYRSVEALRHPRTSARSRFFAACEAVAYPTASVVRRRSSSLTASRERLDGFVMVRAGMGSFDFAEPFAPRMAGLRSG